MKGLSLEMVGIFAGAVDFIAQKGMPKAGHMYTDLVGAACLKTALYIGGVPETFQNLIMGDGILAVFVVDGPFSCGQQGDGRLAPLRFPHPPSDCRKQ